MAEKYSKLEEAAVNGIAALALVHPPESDVIHVDFRPNLKRDEIMRRIGEILTTWWLTEAGAGTIAHEPISVYGSPEDTLSVRLKQFKSGYDGDGLGIPHRNNSGEIETINVLDLEWNAHTHSITPHYIHPRNFRYILIGHQALRRTIESRSSVDSIKKALWGV